MKSPHTEFSVDIAGNPIRCVQEGAGPPILLIHGLIGGAFCWRFALPMLARRFTACAVDLPGMGLSEAIKVDCSISAQADRLIAFADSMHWKEFAVIGASFGGAVAILLAARAGSSRVSSIVLCAPANPWSDFSRRRVHWLGTRLGGYFLRTLLPVSRPVQGIALRRVFGDPSRIPTDSLDAYRASISRPGRAQNLVSVLKCWENDMDLVRQSAPEIRSPALVVWGQSDRVVDPLSAIQLSRHLRNAEIKFIPGAGHLPFEETPDEFNHAIMDFLAAAETNDR